MSIEAMKLALEALENSETLINGTDYSFGLAGAMDGYYSGCFDLEKNEKLMNQAITALRQAIEQAQKPEGHQEPVAYWIGYAPENGGRWLIEHTEPSEDQKIKYEFEAVYTSPPQRQPLTDEEILAIARDHYNPHQRAEISFARAIEAAHGIKGEA